MLLFAFPFRVARSPMKLRMASRSTPPQLHSPEP
jgi:hypothetical protein